MPAISSYDYNFFRGGGPPEKNSKKRGGNDFFHCKTYRVPGRGGIEGWVGVNCSILCNLGWGKIFLKKNKLLEKETPNVLISVSVKYVPECLESA